MHDFSMSLMARQANLTGSPLCSENICTCPIKGCDHEMQSRNETTVAKSCKENQLTVFTQAQVQAKSVTPEVASDLES